MFYHQGEFNSGKSTFINALLGKRYLKEGVVPTTNEITFLRYSESDSNETQRCERHPDGQCICYIPARILKEVSYLICLHHMLNAVHYVNIPSSFIILLCVIH